MYRAASATVSVARPITLAADSNTPHAFTGLIPVACPRVVLIVVLLSGCVVFNATNRREGTARVALIHIRSKNGTAADDNRVVRLKQPLSSESVLWPVVLWPVERVRGTTPIKLGRLESIVL